MSVTGSASSTNLNVLKGKIRSLSPYAIDPSLSVEGASADAKATGDALEKKADKANIVDNLTSDDAEMMLSAKQGKVLKKNIDDIRSELILETQTANDTATAAQSKATSAQATADTANATAEEAIEIANEAKSNTENVLTTKGGTMAGNLNMGGYKITVAGDPTDDLDLVTKKYVDEKYLFLEVTLSASGWAGSAAPYTQTVIVSEILETDRPHFGPVYSSNNDTMLAEMEAWAMVVDLETHDGYVVFTCPEEMPATELTIQMEVHR